MNPHESKPEPMNQTLKLARAVSETREKLNSREATRQDRRREVSFVGKRIESNFELSL